MFDITVNSHGRLTNMPKFRTFEKLYKELNITHEEETPSIPSSALPSNNLSQSDHSIADSLFEDYSDGRGVLMWKGKRKRITDSEFSEFTELMKNKGEE